MISIYKKITEATEQNIPVYLATVISTSGSSPGSIGMKFLVYSDGSIYGTIGGGAIEKKVIDKIIQKKPKTVEKWTFDLGSKNETGEKTGMICGGIQEILVEPLLPGIKLYITGGGHCAMALSTLAAKTGFAVTIIDDRPEWANKEKHPDATYIICASYEDVIKHIDFSPDIFIVIMTHAHKYDETVLRQVSGKPYKYLGMIGSQNKVKIILKKLKNDGFPLQDIKNIFAPIGFDIGSNTPDEIAVSILAQMIAVRNQKENIKFNSNPLV